MFSVGNAIQVAGINVVLSSDNAIVIALQAKGLDKYLKKKAIFLGSVAAAILLVIMTVISDLLLMIPLVGVLGGLFLLKVAESLPRQLGEEHIGHSGNRSLKQAIKGILSASIVMSTDNALALASAAHGDFLLIAIGIVVGSVVVLLGGHAVSWLLHKFPILVYVGAGVLAHAASEMIFEDKFLNRFISFQDYADWGSWVVALVLVLYSFVVQVVRRQIASNNAKTN
jgi:YjbE family integral membrane protein